MSQLRSPDAYMACLMLSDQPWSMDSVDQAKAQGRRLVSGGPEAVLAAAIGGLAGWVGEERCYEWLSRAAMEIAPQGKIIYPRAPDAAEPLFVLAAATALRDCAWDGRSGEKESPINEYVFCVSDVEDCQRLGALRKSLGLVWSEENLAGCARAMARAMDQALSRGVGAELMSACVADLAARLALVESVRPELLAFALKWGHAMRFPRGAMGLKCVAFEDQVAEVDECSLARIDWGWAASAPSAKGRSDFPWGFWLAWSAPSLLESWGAALGARWEDDALLAREAAAFQYDRDEWSKDETQASASAAMALERQALSASTAMGRPEPKRSL